MYLGLGVAPLSWLVLVLVLVLLLVLLLLLLLRIVQERRLHASLLRLSTVARFVCAWNGRG